MLKQEVIVNHNDIVRLQKSAIVVADDKSEFALTLETSALKKSANIHVFEQFKKELDTRLLEGKDKEETKEGKAKSNKHIHSKAEGEIQMEKESGVK